MDVPERNTDMSASATPSGSWIASICRRLPEPAVIISMAICVGLLAGCATTLLKRGIAWIGRFASAGNPAEPGWFLLLLPLAGIMLAVLYQKTVGEDLSHGTDQLNKRIKTGRVSMKRNMIWNPLLACLITVGLGGSAGSEGPSAVSGAAIGSRAAKWAGLSPKAMRILLGCGAGAGIAGIFKSPVGGMLFTIEVLRMELSATAMVALVSSCLASFTSAYVLSGFTWDVGFAGRGTFDPAHIGWIALLGLVCGLYSLYYNKTQAATARGLARIKNPWTKALAAGSALSLMVFLLPPMFGEGYGIISDIINNTGAHLFSFSPLYKETLHPSFMLACVAGVLLLKGIAVGAVNYGGGVAGEFAPTLFAGCLTGYLFATLMRMAGIDLPVDNFALMGMAGVMAGTVKAPMMAVFIAAEISDSYSFILGFILVAVISFVITGRPFRMPKS